MAVHQGEDGQNKNNCLFNQPDVDDDDDDDQRNIRQFQQK